jgi:tyrosine-specific transport protein
MAKILGGIFLIVGISIGAGILALPVTTAPSGFIPSTLLLFSCWLLMTFNALLILEVNLWMPENSNIISMAGATLGKGGQAIAWVSYLLLFYSLLSAYISAGSDVLGSVLSLVHIKLANAVTILIFTGLLGFVVYRGTRSIDYLNRALIMTKIGAFILLLILVVPYIQRPYIQYENFSELPSTLMVVITSFGFATLIPSLRTYFNSDAKKLRQVIIAGSIIPLIFYICWDGVILGALPLEGAHGLNAVLHSGNTISQLIFVLHQLLKNDMVTSLAAIFSAICVATSFLGVGLSLSDFLADGLHLQKEGQSAVFIYSFTFIPPLMAVLFYPSLFITALGYAGTYCVILLALLPVCMTWVGRYHKQKTGAIKTLGGKPLLLFVFIVTLVVLAIGVSQEFGIL